MKHYLFSFGVILFLISGGASHASGIFTLKGKLKAFNETTYSVETEAVVYDVKKSELSPEQLTALKAKRTGQPVELVVSTQAIAAVHDRAPSANPPANTSPHSTEKSK